MISDVDHFSQPGMESELLLTVWHKHMNEKNIEIEKYRESLFEYLDPTFNRMMLVGIAGFSVAVLNSVLFDSENLIAFYFNSVAALLLAVLFILRKEINPVRKSQIIVGFLTLFAAVILFVDGNELAGMLMIVLDVLIIIMVFDQTHKRVSLIITTGIVLSSFLWNSQGEGASRIILYFYSFAAYLVMIIIFPKVINTIYLFLFSKLDLLEQKVIREQKAYDLLKKKNQEIEKLAYFDPLTGLYNRRRFTVLMNREIVQASGSLLFLNVINFQKFNTLYGFRKGDSIIASIADSIREKIGPDDQAAYLGANSFAVYFRTSLDSLKFERMVKDMESDLNRILDLTITLGFYGVYIIHAGETRNFDDYCVIADDSWLKMKDSGHYRRFVDNKEALIIAADRKRKEFILGAIQEHRYDVYFQEKVSLNDDRVVGLEALARLQYEGQFISPSHFIEVIETEGSITLFGFQIIEMVFARYSLIRQKYGDIRVSINLSPKQLAERDFLPQLNGLIESYSIPTDLIEFEITENSLISNFDELIGIINSIRDLGIRISIDDFGTGYSSLSYVSRLPADVIKIDKFFIDDIQNNDKTRSIIRGIVEIAEASGIEVVAEGVENEIQVGMLKSLGCMIIQGYYFSKPAPIA